MLAFFLMLLSCSLQLVFILELRFLDPDDASKVDSILKT